MKKLLLTTAVAGFAFAAPAHAGVNLDVSGYFVGYVAHVDQDENDDERVSDTDFIKATELHFTGETTLDNGLTVGAHIELDVDRNDDSSVEESYAYFSGSWGRVNFGEEDGVAFLLQVAAPSADSHVDGIRPIVDGVNEDVLLGANADSDATTATATFGALSYDQDQTGYETKLSYLSPVVNGFQVGASYTPNVDGDTSTAAVGTDNAEDASGEAYEVAVRYEGEFEGVGVTAGAGYTSVELEANTALATDDATDDRTAWNVGLDLDFGPFGAGVSYQEDDHGEQDLDGTVGGAKGDDEEILVVGVDYTTGPFKLGASYYDAENVQGNDGIDAQRYTGGVVYTYGPGMTLRGSVSYVEYEGENLAGADIDDADATQFLIGTKVKF